MATPGIKGGWMLPAFWMYFCKEQIPANTILHPHPVPMTFLCVWRGDVYTGVKKKNVCGGEETAFGTHSNKITQHKTKQNETKHRI